ncbi:MAG TPA: hypothetical protein VF522_21770 [Ramlibacter sp.]|uniref:hypothetical protein n=1 Tax=Ramlibacter sp. TaxID=1917967 RepID=UPI002ECFDC22
MATADTFVPGNVVVAALLPQAVHSFDPVLRRLLAGQQFFVKLEDGRWRPQGCALGLGCCCFEFSDLQAPELRD